MCMCVGGVNFLAFKVSYLKFCSFQVLKVTECSQKSQQVLVPLKKVLLHQDQSQKPQSQTTPLLDSAYNCGRVLSFCSIFSSSLISKPKLIKKKK